jgi:serine palmitoyltransferase
VAIVAVGFPATPVVSSRIRFCISAGHTRESLDHALAKIEKAIERNRVRYTHSLFG